MAKVKMRYGIDLGTTNSSICRIENGEPVIKKTDTLKDTLPSCVAFTRKKVIKTGDSAFNFLRQDKARATKEWDDTEKNVFIEFKRTMGLDKEYFSSNMGKGFSSEELSAEILKSLRTFVSDENVDSAVITIPAKFKTDQIAATKRAAELAGIKHSELLQEPIAASIAYGLSTSSKNGNWVVFDFGGGTFDAALLKVEEGIIQVKDTEGDNYLGGKNLDYAIVDQILIPHLESEYQIDDIISDEQKRNILRDALKFYAEQIKNQLSFNPKTDVQSQLDEFGEDDDGDPIDLDIVVTKEEVDNVLRPTFQKAIDITKNLIQRNSLSADSIDALVLVGGPTYSPLLRQMLRDQITPNVECGIDPMTAVAKGAALFAANVESKVVQEISEGTVALDVSYEANSVETSQIITVKLNLKESKGYRDNSVFVEFVRGDKAWSSGKIEVSPQGALFECELAEGKSNSFTLNAYDKAGNLIPCFPKEINIMHGIVVGNAVLPYHIGIEAHNPEAERDEFVPLRGLEKNQSIPAVGVKNGLKTQATIRPGVKSDGLIIPIYQGEINSAGTNAKFNDHVFDLKITGDEVSGVIPRGSDVDITIKVDASQMMHAEIFFHALGDSIEKDIKIEPRHGVTEDEVNDFMSIIEKKFDEARMSSFVSVEELEPLEEEYEAITNRWDEEISADDGRMHLLSDLRRLGLKLDSIENKHAFDTLKEEVDKLINIVEQSNQKNGKELDSEINAVKRQVNQATRKKDVKALMRCKSELNRLNFKANLLEFLITWVMRWNDNFSREPWKDKTRARELLAKANGIIQRNPTEQALLPIVRALFGNLDYPENQKIRI